MYTQRDKRGVQDVSLRAGGCVSMTSAGFFKTPTGPARKLCTELCTDLTGPGWIQTYESDAKRPLP
jgi:hypothetical protein